MTNDPLDTLRALNPVPDSSAPQIELLWRRLDDAPEAAVAARGRLASTKRMAPARRPVWGSPFVAALTVAIAAAVAIGAVIALKPNGRPSREPGAAANARSLTRILGVLRRPQTAADRRLATPRLFSFARHPRRLTQAGTLVPVTETPLRSLKRIATTLQSGVSIGLIPVQTQSTTASGKPFSRVALEMTETGGGGSSCCSTTHQIKTGQAFSSSGGAGQKNVGILVVPDGVGRVRVALPHPVTVSVKNNIAVIETDADLENINQYAMTWYAPSGAVIKKFATPRDTKPSRAQAEAQRNYAIRRAQTTKVHLRPFIRASYPLFGSQFSTLTVGSGSTGFTVSRPKLTQLPTEAIQDAGTVPKYRTDPRNARLLHTGTGLNLWLAAGGRICIYGLPIHENGCTPTGPAASGQITLTSTSPNRGLIVALVPKNNSSITVITAGGSHAVPLHDGLAVIPAGNVTALRYARSDGHTVIHRFGAK